MAAAKTSSAKAAASPVSKEEFSRLMAPLGPFEDAPHLAVALSGGSDSMALALLAYDWASSRHGRITAITVEHGIRPESAAEAEQVASWCKQRGITHVTLRWQPPVRVTQNSARDARYQLLARYCNDHTLLHLLTAHHSDDQMETLFLRLARGSGLSGLSGMAAVSVLDTVRLLRPLLPVPKSRLVATLEVAAQPWAEDASNAKPLYTRNRLRHMLQSSPQHDAMGARSLAVTDSLGNFRNQLNKMVVSYSTYSAQLRPEGYGWLQRDALMACPPGIASEVVQQLVMTLAGLTHPPRSETLERLLADLQAGISKRNACGLIFEFKNRQHAWLVSREPEACAPPLALLPHAPGRWDRRFAVGFSGPEQNLTVRALGTAEMAWLKNHEHYENLMRNYTGRKMVLASLPSFWHLEKMIAVPHINYVHPDFRYCSFSARFSPAKALAAPAFRSIRLQT